LVLYRNLEVSHSTSQNREFICDNHCPLMAESTH
jgi:hypothetical protein